MKTAKKLHRTPMSGEYEEIIFDLPAPWKKESWNYVKFTTSNEIDLTGV